MTHSRPRLITATLIALLAGVACLLVVVDGLRPSDRHGRVEEFQRLNGGLGFGPAVDLARCAFSFDPRLCLDCPLNHGPVSGGVYFCPQHACSILYYPPLAAEEHGPAEGEGDGRSP